MKIISACLCGICTNLYGQHRAVPEFIRMMREGTVVPVCPEQLGGLSTPRPSAEIVGGDGFDVLEGRAKVLTENGDDVTESFIRGAKEVLKIVKIVQPELIILNERSPSCGAEQIYDGTFSKTIIKGSGVTTALLIKNGFNVVSDEKFLATD